MTITKETKQTIIVKIDHMMIDVNTGRVIDDRP